MSRTASTTIFSKTTCTATFSSADSGLPSPAAFPSSTRDYSPRNYQHVVPQPPTTNHSHQLSTDDENPIVAVIASNPAISLQSNANLLLLVPLNTHTFALSIYLILPFKFSLLLISNIYICPKMQFYICSYLNMLL